MNRPSLPAALVLAALLVTSGCGGDDSPAPVPSPAALGTATIAPTALPTGWPAVAFPEGTQVLASDTGTEAGTARLSVTFDSTELPSSIVLFLAAQLKGAGFTQGATRSTFDGTTITYAGAGRTATLEISDQTTHTEGSLVITGGAAPVSPAS